MQYDPLMYVDGMNTTSYVQNMPIMMIDPIGWKLVVTIWTTGGESGVGHAGIAVSNYDGKKPNGSYTYYDLWPGEPVNFVSMDAISYVKPFRNELFIESNKVFRQNFLYPDEEIAPDGVIQLDTSYEQDMSVLDKLTNPKKDYYNGASNNCTSNVSDALSDVLGKKLGKETFMKIGLVIPVKFHTPNQLWKDVISSADKRGIPYTIISDPGNKANNKFLPTIARDLMIHYIVNNLR